jgi:isopentenyl diphosphate isomerase/L-lactate dehydrogenase-like FMN-dependent dehydrogenase
MRKCAGQCQITARSGGGTIHGREDRLRHSSERQHDDDLTLKANVEAFRHFALKPRRLVDVSKPDLSTEVYGVR